MLRGAPDIASDLLFEAHAPWTRSRRRTIRRPSTGPPRLRSGALVKLLITYDGERHRFTGIDPQNRWKQTPLSQAAAKHADAVRVLLEREADVNNRDFAGYTPLHVAAENGNVESARLLVGAGAPLDARDSVGITPLDVAREHDLTEVAALLEGQDTPPRSLRDSE